MTLSSVVLRDANKMASQSEKISAAFNDPTTLTILYYLHTHEKTDIPAIESDLGIDAARLKKCISFCQKAGLIKASPETITLTDIARIRLSNATATLEFKEGQTIEGKTANIKDSLEGTYTIQDHIGHGATSYTFLVTQERTCRDRTLKVFLPDTISYEQLREGIKKRAQVKHQAIPEIFDSGEIEAYSSKGASSILPCVVLGYVPGQTFSQFLKESKNISSAVLDRFIEYVGGALAEIEKAGLSHGDLHEGNILVEVGAEPNVAQKFWVIDFIGVPSTFSPEIELPSDMVNFKNHLLHAAILACERAPGVSARRVLGDRVFRVLEGLRGGRYSAFSELLNDFHKRTALIPADHFNKPIQQPFEWLRVEWVLSPKWLYLLFEPDYARYNTIARFGNTWISGPRGCGKSHYLRVLGFHPSALVATDDDRDLADKLTQLNYNFRDTFGILFACRLGEFKGFTPAALRQKNFDPATQAFLRHIIVLKIWNKTLSTLQGGIESIMPSTGRSVLDLPPDIKQLRSFLEERLGKMAIVEDSDIQSVFRQCLNICAAKESSAIAVWDKPSKRAEARLLDERDLDAFFEMVKDTFYDLQGTRFYILVDDASYGHIDFEMQKVLNSLVRAAHANCCFKITYDRFMYTLDTSDGRPIDPRHEVTYVDLGEVSTKAQRETAVDLSKYMARVVNTRLKAANYKADIQTILGESQTVSEFLSGLSQKRYIRKKDKQATHRDKKRIRAYYAGWNIIWSISHGSVRTLLELIEHIFKTNAATPAITHIPLAAQDAAVRSYSVRHYKALAMLPGEIDEEPLGQRLQAIISAIGQMSRQYLLDYDTKEEGRWYETISVERLDRSTLHHKAGETLMHLIMHGLLLDEGLTYSRAQIGLSQRYDLNKIFSPAFEITYRVRNHIYLGRQRLEELFLKPDAFLRRHRSKLAELTKSDGKRKQVRLFEDD